MSSHANPAATAAANTAKAAKEVFGTNELLENILGHIDGTKAVVKLSSLSKTAHEIIHSKCGRDLRWETYLKPIHNKTGRKMWLVDKKSREVTLVKSDHIISKEDRKTSMLQQPVVLNPVLFHDKHYGGLHVRERLILSTEAVSPNGKVERLMKQCDPSTVEGVLAATSLAKMLVCQPPTQKVLIDWYQTFQNGSGYGTSGAHVVYNPNGVTLGDFVRAPTQFKDTSKGQDIKVHDFRIPDAFFVTHYEWNVILHKSTRIPTPITPPTLPKVSMHASRDRSKLRDLLNQTELAIHIFSYFDAAELRKARLISPVANMGHHDPFE